LKVKQGNAGASGLVAWAGTASGAPAPSFGVPWAGLAGGGIDVTRFHRMGRGFVWRSLPISNRSRASCGFWELDLAS